MSDTEKAYKWYCAGLYCSWIERAVSLDISESTLLNLSSAYPEESSEDIYHAFRAGFDHGKGLELRDLANLVQDIGADKI